MLPLTPNSGNTNVTPRVEITQEWMDRVEEYIREAGRRSILTPVLESKTLLADGHVQDHKLRTSAATPEEERGAGLSDALLDAIMDENLIALCEDVEKVLDGMSKGR